MLKTSNSVFPIFIFCSDECKEHQMLDNFSDLSTLYAFDITVNASDWTSAKVVRGRCRRIACSQSIALHNTQCNVWNQIQQDNACLVD